MKQHFLLLCKVFQVIFKKILLLYNFFKGSSILHESLVASSTIPTNTGGIISIGSDPEADLPLPPHWEVEVTPEGIRYYVDHDHRRTHWIHPLAVENLSPNWIKIFDQVHGVVYFK